MRFLSKHDFDREATALSKALLMLHQQEECVDNDGSTLNQWTLTEADSPDLYLIHPPIHRRSATHKRDHYDVPIEEVLGDEEQQVRIDDVTVVATPTPQCYLEWTFSIIYSHTWSVPVLYFRVLQTDGSALGRQDILQELGISDEPQCYQDAISSWDFISEEHHPVSGIPAFFLHPCQTSERMDAILHASSRKTDTQHGLFLLSWLSLILPAIHFKIDAKQFASMSRILSQQANDVGMYI